MGASGANRLVDRRGLAAPVLPTDAGQIGRAESIYAEVIKGNPDDPDLLQAAKNLSARRTMAEGGYGSLADGTGTFRDALHDKGQAVALEPVPCMALIYRPAITCGPACPTSGRWP